MARSVELLLIKTVESLGIVGDIVKVKPGYARNFLLPHGLAEFPTRKRIEELQEERKRVQAELAALRTDREKLLERMDDVSVSIVRSCNDQGLLYGSVTQKDISEALHEAGYDVGIRSVRLGQPLKRVGSYPVPIQFDKDLRTEVTVVVEPDRPIGEEREEMEFDNEGNLIIEPKKRSRRHREAEKPAETAETGETGEKPADGETPSEPAMERAPAAS